MFSIYLQMWDYYNLDYAKSFIILISRKQLHNIFIS
jgi:hypothetical protein